MIVRILRHGETEYNKEWRFLGQKDLPLSEEGKGQLFASKDRPERVYVSDLQRTRQTAEIIYPGAEYVAVPELKEMDFGAFEGRTWLEMKDEPEFQAWIASERFDTCPGGEGRREFSERVCSALSELVRKEAREGREELTIVAHGGTIMAAMERFCIDLPGEYSEWRLGNGEGYLVDCYFGSTGMCWHVIRRLSYHKKAGRVHLYYGEGRGKTSLAAGTALRALQRGWDVSVLQFCKNEGSGEMKQLRKTVRTKTILHENRPDTNFFLLDFCLNDAILPNCICSEADAVSGFGDESVTNGEKLANRNLVTDGNEVT